jgi:microcystin-dependent protein
MSQPYVGEIRMFGGNFAPAGWAFCQGQLIPISQNDTLFTLIGTTYGGDGQNTFALPDLQGRVPVHNGTNSGTGTNYQIGEKAGVESVTLTTQQIPVHNHAFIASGDIAQNPQPTDSLVAQSATVQLFITDVASSPLDAQMLGVAGGSQPHENLQPYLCVSYILSLFGLFPHQ